MVFATLFPIGVYQLYESVSRGYFEARELKFLTSEAVSFVEWLRLPGDVVFIAGGVLPLLWLCWRGVRYKVKVTREPKLDEMLFTEVTGGAGE